MITRTPADHAGDGVPRETAELDAAETESGNRQRARKAPNAFRTISEVADELQIPQHVLRFWEGKFAQVKPLKRGGGRRYYRPDDIALLRRISSLLYIQGYTIKGVQRLLREGGGQLADDIGPPAPEEKAGPETMVFTDPEDPLLPMPGLAPMLMPPSLAPEPKPRAPRPAASRSVLAQAIASGEHEAEIARLQALLRVTLQDLEALRGLLG